MTDMATKTTTKKFGWLKIGDVIVDIQGKRHTVTAIARFTTAAKSLLNGPSASSPIPTPKGG